MTEGFNRLSAKGVGISPFILIVSFLLLTPFVFSEAQKKIADSLYWIGFTDKAFSPYNIEAPEEFLSPRSIERRIRQNIAFAKTDMPVSPYYIDSLKNMGFEITNTSKWLNGIIVKSPSDSLLNLLSDISFVKKNDTSSSNKVSASTDKKISTNALIDESRCLSEIDYGFSSDQLTSIKGEYLHNKGYTGEGMLIAVLDAGYYNAHVMSSFHKLWSENRVIGTANIPKDGESLFGEDAHKHGSTVLSILAGELEGRLHGSAVDAEYLLIRTEQGDTEQLSEEYYWACGAEYADSMGADILNTSLGYAEFDNEANNHTTDDLDGVTAPISVAMGIAATKGMLVVTSAGNSGNKPWRKITAPADAINIISVGAVDANDSIAAFSSRGYSADGRVKPEIVAQGVKTISQGTNNAINECNGTSCSSPIISGLAACLWQANRQKPSLEIREAIIRSGSQYLHPDSAYGYGIPNFIVADRILKLEELYKSESFEIVFLSSCNSDKLCIEIFNRQNYGKSDYADIVIYDILGKKIFHARYTTYSDYNQIDLDIGHKLSTGIYFLTIEQSNAVSSINFLIN